MINLNLFFFLLALYALSLIGTFFYRKFAVKSNILASINFRTLHDEPTPRGGGLVFSIVFVLSVFFLYFHQYVGKDLMLVFAIGGGLAGTVGYVDDIISISAVKKLILQCLLVLWMLAIFSNSMEQTPSWLNLYQYAFITMFFLVWLINVYNFIDGIDGMAISASILILLTLVFTIIFSNNVNNSIELLLIILTLLVSCLGFFFFNWPKATIFMGDSGSIFLGYCFGALIVYSTMTGKISFFTWLVVFGYYLSDTSITTLIRIIIVKRWYGTHRSHAYQNLARIFKNHTIVTNGVIIYHLLWLLPLAVSTTLIPEYKFLAVLLAFLPPMIWTIKFGPLFSKD